MLEPEHQINRNAILEHQALVALQVRASSSSSALTPGSWRATIGEAIIRLGERVHGNAASLAPDYLAAQRPHRLRQR